MFRVTVRVESSVVVLGTREGVRITVVEGAERRTEVHEMASK